MRVIKYLLLTSLIVFLSACGGGGGDDSESNPNTLTINVNSHKLQYNKEQNLLDGVIEFKGNGFATSDLKWKEIKLENFSVTVGSCDIYQSKLGTTEINFVNNGVKDLNISLRFEQSCYNPTLTLKADQKIKVLDPSNSKNDKFTTTTYSKSFNLFDSDGRVVTEIQTGYPTVEITQKPTSMKQSKGYSFYYQVLDSGSNKLIDESLISNIEIKSINEATATLIDSNLASTPTIFTTKPEGAVTIQTFKESGDAKFSIFATLKSGKTYENIISIPVLSELAYSLSILYQGTTFENPYYVATYLLSAINESGNPIGDGESISIGFLNHIKTFGEMGKLEQQNGLTIFNAEKNVTSSGVNLNDEVIIYPKKNYNEPAYLGNWHINTITNDNILTFKERYFGSSISNLSYVIGDRNEYSSCESSNVFMSIENGDNEQIWTEVTTSANGEQNLSSKVKINETDYMLQNGQFQFKVKYSSNMIGKEGYIYAQLDNENNRAGVALKEYFLPSAISVSIVPITVKYTGGTHTIQGYVRTVDNYPLKEAEVLITVNGANVSGGSKVIEIETNCNGYFNTNNKESNGTILFTSNLKEEVVNYNVAIMVNGSSITLVDNSIITQESKPKGISILNTQ